MDDVGAQEPVDLAAKVRFLADGAAYGAPGTPVLCRETHMSWVFLWGDRAYKLKKPVRFPYLDFSTLRLREAACRAELRLNRRLAPDVYLAVTALTRRDGRLMIGGTGAVVDWLVTMRRLDECSTLESRLARGPVAPSEIEKLVRALVRFYRQARRIQVRPGVYQRRWQRNLELNRRVLTRPDFGLPLGRIGWIQRIQREFVGRGDALAARVIGGRIVNGHGDLRPEHIYLEDGIRIIDCLEFNPELRAVDAIDEVAYLAIECERVGARRVGDRIRRGVMSGLHDRAPEVLFAFYACYRATLRARLAIAHLLDAAPRTPERWPMVAREYLAIAERHAARLDRLLRKR
ncbi:MAG: hypothetical protein ACM30I_17975 [Gemmatimonas sp.]